VAAPGQFVSIVEDDSSLREALAGLLRCHGYKVRAFASAEEYLAVRDGLCACVISDIRMPGLSGLEMASRLREMGYDVPMIMITARVDAEMERQAAAGGAVCLLEKPFEAEALLDCLARALSP
jgi:FixJ family two-component response regulator